MSRIHPFRLWLLQAGKSQREAADELGIDVSWLSQALNNKVDVSTELYRDMVRLAKGAITLKELTAFRKPSTHRRRKLVDLKPATRVRKSGKEQPPVEVSGEPEKLH